MTIKFNEQQKQAIEHREGAMSVIANPGSGKSTVLLGRIEKLVREHKVQEHSILAITFTRNTADHMIKELNKRDLSFINVGTFHSICGQILRKEGIDINPRNMIKEWQADNCFKKIDKGVDTKEVLGWIGYQKNYMRTSRDEFVKKDSFYSIEELRSFYKEYEDFKSKQNLYDFDDYLLLCYKMLKDSPGKYTFDYILVDEHQDSNTVQNLLLKEWCVNNNIFVVSDPKQALYGFRGGNIEYSMNFEKYWDDATVVSIDTNYRSKKNIIEKANEFIRDYYKDFEHYADSIPFQEEDGHIEVNSYASRGHEGDKVANEIQKLLGDGVQPKDIAVLYRNNKHADFVENQLKRRKIDYEIANDSSFFKRREVAGILSFLRLARDNDDNNAFEGAFRLRVDPLKFFSNVILRDIQNTAGNNDISLFDALVKTRYPQAWHMKNASVFRRNVNRVQDLLHDGDDLGDVIDEIVRLFKFKQMINEKYTHKPEKDERLESIKTLKLFAKGSSLEDFLEFAYSDSGKKKEKKENAVQLMTIHRSKGLEWDNVFVIGVEDKEFPSQREGAMNDIEEEARLFYVSVTRSKENLYISEIGQGNRFIEEYGKV